MHAERIGIYPGTFDPIHKGHLDVIKRATLLLDRLIVAVSVNAGKGPLFSLEERASMVEADLNGLKDRGQTNGTRLQVEPFEGLLVHFAAEHSANVLVRGLRAVSDFEYEFQMAANNKRIAPAVETVFLMASETNQFTSSRFVKEIHLLGGDVSSFVTERTLSVLDAKRGR